MSFAITQICTTLEILFIKIMTHEEINKSIINQLNLYGLNWFYENYKDDQLDFEFEYKKLNINVAINGTGITKDVYTDMGELYKPTGIDNLQKEFNDWYEYYSRCIEDYTNMNDTYNTLNEKYR